MMKEEFEKFVGETVSNEDYKSNVPMNPDTEDMEEEWFIFPKGTNREAIWNWFDENHSKGVGWIMNHEN